MLFNGKLGKNKVLNSQNDTRNYPKEQCKHGIKKESVSLVCCEKNKRQLQIKKPRKPKPETHHQRPTCLAISKRKFGFSCLQSFGQTVLGAYINCKYLDLPFPPGVVCAGQRRCYSHTTAG